MALMSTVRTYKRKLTAISDMAAKTTHIAVILGPSVSVPSEVLKVHPFELAMLVRRVT